MKKLSLSGAKAGAGPRGLLYRSHALGSRHEFEASGAPADFAARNASLGLGGYLHLEDGLFYQFLEGGQAALETVWASIRRDPRHADISVLFEGPVPERRFAGWSMGYSHAEEQSLFDWTARSGLSLKGRDSAQIVLGFLLHVSSGAAARPGSPCSHDKPLASSGRAG